MARWAAWGALLLATTGLLTVGARSLRGHAVAPVRYEMATVDRGGVDAKVTATGTVSAIVTVQVGSQVSGRIDKLFVDFSSPVKKGQVVATIDPALLKAAMAQARASYLAGVAAVEKSRAARVQAERQLVRAKQLHAQGLASQADLDVTEAAAWSARADVAAAEASVVQLHAALDQAALNLSYATIVSPIDGTVISRNVDVGQTVAAALQAPTLFTIAQDLTKMQVDTSVAEADVGKLREGMGVTFTVDAYPNRPFPGRVRQVRDAATTVQNVVTYDAVIDFDNTARLLRPGMTASATFVHAQKADVLRLPNAALRFKPDPATVAKMTAVPGRAAPAVRPASLKLAPSERVIWVQRGGRAEPVTIKVGITDGTVTEVVSGPLAEGDAVVSEALVEASGQP
jgi:HlyD family secretion protein